MRQFILPLVILAIHFIPAALGSDTPVLFETTYTTVHIVSGVPNTPTILRFRCQSGDDDLGMHELQLFQEYSWEFGLNVFGRTLFFCHFYWGAKDRSFTVYESKLNKYCSGGRAYEASHQDCYWVATPTGFFISKDENTWIKMHDWTLP
ncbi:S-protein homolog 2-like [Rhododendron vialii]|uniref:S-protein homolog 2-like n=1 Tax=Rhododendron vialii TaxID=182163 RepID=UPI00265EAE4E|nr:S-protein homolog 2-like [Rhododendron vialii]